LTKRHYTKLPAITGKQLIRLFEQDSWEVGKHATHGLSMTKRFGDRTKVVFVPDKAESLPTGTLLQIIGPKQAGLGKKGLLRLITKHGLK